MLAIAALGLLHVGCGLMIAQYFFRPSRICDVILSSFLIAFFTFYGLPILIGWLTGHINTLTVLMAGAFAVSAAVLAWWKFRKPEVEFSRFRAAILATSWVERLLLALIISYAGLTYFLAANLPIRAYDAVGYHSLAPMAWAVDGKFTLHVFGNPHLDYYVTHGETFPNAKAVLPFLVLWWTGFEEGTALAQWPFLLIAIAAVFAIMRRMNLPVWASCTAVLFVLFAPEVFLQSLEAYADLQFFAGQAAVVWVLLLLWDERPSVRLFLLAAISFSIIAGAKPNALLMNAALGALLLVFVWIRTSNAVISRKAAQCIAAVVTVLVVCLVVSGPWYLHAWKSFGNPVYPIAVTIGSHELFPGVGQQTVANEMIAAHTGASGLRGWWMTMNEAHRQPVIASWAGGLGAHALILGVPALLLLLCTFGFEEDRKRVALFLLFFVVLFMASPVRNWARMVLFELILYGFAFARIMVRSDRIPRMVLAIVFVFLASYNAARTLPAYLYRMRIPEIALYPIITGNSRAAMIDELPGTYNVKEFWRESIAKEGDLLAVTAETEPVWTLRPLERRASVVRVTPLLKASSPVEWYDEILASGATHFYAPSMTPEFSAAMNLPQKFELVLWRLDSGAEAPWNIINQPEAALFKVVRSGSARQ